MAGPWEQYQSADGPWTKYAPAKPSVAEDVGKSAVAGAQSGVAGLAGAMGTLGDLWNKGGTRALAWGLTKLGYFTPDQAKEAIDAADKLSAQFSQDARMKDAASAKTLPQKIVQGVDAAFSAPTGAELMGRLDEVSPVGPSYKPQTLLGDIAKTGTEFGVAYPLTSGSTISRLGQTFIPAVTSEVAGQTARQVAPEFEPAARAGGALLGGIGTGIALSPSTAREAIGRSMQAVTPQQMQAAETLLNDAAGMGVRLTWDEAIQQVTGGATNLGNLRRVVENSEGGGSVLKPMMAERPGKVQRAGNVAIGDIGRNPPNPVQTGTRASLAAQDELDRAQRAVNAATRPDYRAAEAQRVTPAVSQALQSDPLYARALNEVRNNPELNRTIANLPDDSVAVVDLVQRRMREAAQNRAVPGQANSSNLAAANLEDARTAPIAAAEQVTGGPYGDYARARQGQERLRREFLEPLNNGPLGKVAGTTDVQAQGRAILPNAPAPGSESVVAETVSRIARRDPQAAEGVIHSVVRGVFDETTQNLATGPNQFGGAKFAAAIAGNGQQARNLEAAVRALPDGDVRWAGFRRFLDVMEATGQRPQAGSMTSFNTQLMQDMKQGGVVSTAVETAKTGGTALIRRLMDYRDRLNLGENTAEVARILTDPRAGRLLRQLANEPPNSQRAAALALRLTYMGNTGAASERNAKPQPLN